LCWLEVPCGKLQTFDGTQKDPKKFKIELTLILVSLVERTNHKHDLDGKPLYPLHEAWQGSNYKHAYIYTWKT